MRFLSQLKPAGTNSYRLATSKLFGFGGNCQNTDKAVIDIMCAPPSYKIVQVDQSGAEALVVAYLARPGRYRNLFLHGVKPHIYVALHIFGDKFMPGRKDEYWLADPADLKKLPDWKPIASTVANSKFEYDIGKKVGHACCDDQTEVLTPTGWVNISTMPEVIMTCDIAGNGGFNKVAWNRYEYQGKMYHFDGEEAQQVVTPNHKMLYETNYNRKTVDASQFHSLSLGTQQMINTMQADSAKHVDPLIVRLAAAIQADGSYAGNRVQFHFEKDRKFERLVEILDALNVDQDWKVTCEGRYKCSLGRLGPVAQACNLLTDDKMFAWEILQLSQNNLQVLVNEVVYWDGSVDEGPRNYRVYFSKPQQNADVIYTAARLVGIGSTKRLSKDGVWQVSFNKRTRSASHRSEKVQYAGLVYCPTTPTGFFLIRRGGKISCTGNSNYMMGPYTFQLNCLKESEGTLVLSADDSKMFLGTYKMLFPEVVELQMETIELVRRDRELINLLGYPRRFERNFTDSYFREAISWRPQSTVGCITHIAYRRLYDTYPDRVRLINNKHDSYAALVRDDDVPEMALKMQQFMEQRLVGRDGAEFTMRAEIQVGQNMKKFNEKTNPQGMKNYD